MSLQGSQLNTLLAIANVQRSTLIDGVEDVQLAEVLAMDLDFVRAMLVTLSEAGYIYLEKFETLAGMIYLASLTSEGRSALGQS